MADYDKVIFIWQTSRLYYLYDWIEDSEWITGKVVSDTGQNQVGDTIRVSKRTILFTCEYDAERAREKSDVSLQAQRDHTAKVDVETAERRKSMTSQSKFIDKAMDEIDKGEDWKG